MRRILFSTVMALAMVQLSCEKSEVNKIAESQACMDSATSGAEASTCMAMVDGLDGPSASRIRVGAVFMQRGFSKTTFVNAYHQLKNPPSGSNATMAVFSYLAFSGNNTFRANATAPQDSSFVVDEALKTESGGLYWLATGAKIGTLVVQYGTGVTVGDPSSFQPADIAAIPSAEVGAIAIQTYSLYCKDSSAASSAACTEFNTAITTGGNDPTVVGCKLKQLLGGNNACP